MPRKMWSLPDFDFTSSCAHLRQQGVGIGAMVVVHRVGLCSIGRDGCLLQGIERQIQLQDVHAAIAEQAEVGLVGVGGDEFADLLRR